MDDGADFYDDCSMNGDCSVQSLGFDNNNDQGFGIGLSSLPMMLNFTAMLMSSVFSLESLESQRKCRDRGTFLNYFLS